jgi:hypothetical protein
MPLSIGFINAAQKQQISSEEGHNIFKEGEKKLKSLRVTAISIDYQKQLKEFSVGIQ